ncbi:hypothetical protein CRENBAI_013233 [Crenichthys baileyi]|uniref:Zinc transporter ZIP3 n=1 Tax=Crenichthys baileyi TaxID=28760 RepID=A0AAV9RYD9_9TELE
MQILVAKLLGLLGLFGLMLAGILVPVRLLVVDYEKASRYRRGLALCNSFGGGVFLATCFNALLPAVRDKVDAVFQQRETPSEKPSFIDLETFNAGGSEAGSDSEYDTPFIPSPRSSTGRDGQRSRGHQHGHFAPTELVGAGPLRLAGLVLALSAHSVFEGLALGLQEDGSKLGSLFWGAVRTGPCRPGRHVARRAIMKGPAKLALKSPKDPTGAGWGGHRSTQRWQAPGGLVLLQGLAAGTFLFVTFFEILSQELEDKQDRLLKVLFLILGYAALAILMSSAGITGFMGTEDRKQGNLQYLQNGFIQLSPPEQLNTREQREEPAEDERLLAAPEARRSAVLFLLFRFNIQMLKLQSEEAAGTDQASRIQQSLLRSLKLQLIPAVLCTASSSPRPPASTMTSLPAVRPEGLC